MKRIIFHPSLFGAYTILALIANNVDRVVLSDSYKIFIYLFIATSILLMLLKLATKSWYRSGLVCTLWVVLFTTYRPVYDTLQKINYMSVVFRQANVLAALWASIFIIMTWWLIRKLRDPVAPNEILNYISVFLVIFPIVRIGWFFLQPANFLSMAGKSNVELASNIQDASFTSQLPDVYYIILDEYGRADVLQELLNYDNREFIDYLHQKGFYIANKSFSNYSTTLMSQASSLNSTYLNKYVSPDRKADLSNTKVIIQMIKENNAKSVFKKAGYRVATFATGYTFTEITDADIYSTPEQYINNFEMEYLNSTILSFGMDPIIAARSRSLTLNIFNGLAKMPEIATDHPKFVFAHIMAGHVPFVFGPNGEQVKPWGFSANPDASNNSDRTYISAYKDQITYINHLMRQTIDSILLKSKRKPIIIIQGDHGPESQLDWFSVENTCLKERMSILNAYYLPDFDQNKLYPSITPVNTFPLIFDYYLGMDQDLNPDKSYFSLWNKSYDFIDVSQRLNTCKTR